VDRPPPTRHRCCPAREACDRINPLAPLGLRLCI
jgi:hypothetical protein